MKKISIVILNYNGAHMIPKCLPSIEAAAQSSPAPCEVIVLDNGSTDGGDALIKKRYGAVKLKRARINDFLFSYNELIETLKSDIVVLLNNDVRVRKNFLRSLLPYFADERVFAVFPKQMSFDGKRCVRGPHRAWMELGAFNVGRIWERGKEKNRPRFTLYGFNGAFDRKKFIRLGGLDRLFRPFTWEDADICYRAWKRGWASIWEPKSVIYHDESHILDRESRMNKGSIRSRRLITRRNSILFFWKNISDRGMIFRHIILHPLKLLHSLLYDRTYIRAFLEALTRLPEALRERPEEELERKFSDREIFGIISSEEPDLGRLSRRERVGIVSTWYKRGVSYQSRFLAKCLSEKFDVRLLAYKKFEGAENPEGVSAVTFRKVLSPKKVIGWIRKEKPRAVFFPDRLEDESVINWCSDNGIATVMIINYETVKRKHFSRYRKITSLLCPVKCTYDLLKKHGLNNLKLIRWSVDANTYFPSDRKFASPVIFLHNAGLGGAGWRKNTEAVIKAFDLATKKRGDIRLILKSQKPIGEYPDIVKKIAGTNPQVTIDDRDVELEELLKIYRLSHVSLLPSKWEGIGLPFIESLSMGLPVITVDAPPMNEWVMDGRNGCCAKVGRWQKMNDRELMIKAASVDVNDLAGKILKLSDPSTVGRMSGRAVLSSKSAFSDAVNSFTDSLIRRSA